MEPWESTERIGTLTLRMLGDPLNAQILEAMAGEPSDPLRAAELLDTVQEAAAADNGDDLEAAEQEGEEPEPEDIHTKHAITAAGLQTLAVRKLLESWLARHPGGALPADGEAAQEAVETLAESWGSGLLHPLAERPRTARELRDAAGGRGERLEANLASMLRHGLLERAGGEAELYAISDWLREASGAIFLAVHIERLQQTTPVRVKPPDADALFQLSLPLLRLPGEGPGACRLEVPMRGAVAGATAHVAEGGAVSCEPLGEDDVEVRAAGSLDEWFSAVVDGGVERLRMEGDIRLPAAIAMAMHERLIGRELPGTQGQG